MSKKNYQITRNDGRQIYRSTLVKAYGKTGNVPITVVPINYMQIL